MAVATASWCARALALAFEDQPDMSDATDVWERAGAHADLVAGPALVRALPVSGDSPIARMSSAATELGAPFHTTQLALRAHFPAIVAGFASCPF